MTLSVFQCNACDHTLFPARYLCPRCGGADWRGVSFAQGTVTEATVVHQRVGQPNAAPLHLASVVSAAGPVVIARSEAALHAGDVVRLTIDSAGAIVASPL
ncbi:Zn-ribbon domain-containing OB-fold protein [Pandoraea sputorum]|uniref:Predicted nucleic-acid-binding protein containing a Zn-ribbon n=1 Tax=Pandoraea sputorum TaxID=93222 RepID=A0A239S8Z3_9BURK|nr:zinc ribbon domain-containing protein [Pandoraea sputorum]AJC16002.1 hypothetical protein NA29_07855 [Pandoraea sputorum]SNU81925.1 Predicted nucleic-acid-binding protein containing a Zn-ribbon [Pandoraea sputorum]VVD61576.1 hypothetical protein PSP20601_00128 [Pandoraea sputorum]